MSTTLKFYKRLNVWKNSGGSCSFDLNTGLGHSYYQLNALVIDAANKVVVLNSEGCSVTTSGHITTLRYVLRNLGYTIKEVKAEQGLDNLYGVDGAYVTEIAKLQHELASTRTKDSTKKWAKVRLAQISEELETLDLLRTKLGR